MIRTILMSGIAAAALAMAPALAADMDEKAAGNEAASQGDMNTTVGAGSDLEGMRYGDLEGRSVVTSDATELGTVANARVTPQGSIDALILKDSGNFGLDEQYVMVPVDRVSPGRSGESDLVVDVTDAEVRTMIDARQQ
jgi:sporulation protein YlmC with PRC-barrel domain